MRIEKIDVMRGAAIALLAAFALSACTTDPSPRTYLDWRLSEHATPRRESAPVAERANWPGATYYTVVVRPHDTVADIAARYDVRDSAVRRMNNIGPRDSIHAGDVLRIPPGSERTREAVLREADSKRIYAEPRDTDYVEDHPLRAPEPERVAHVAPHVVAPIAHVPTAHVEDASFEPSSGAERFIWPVAGHVSSGFGTDGNGERNDGIDVAASEGAPVRAAAAGTVTYAGNELRRYGNLIIIKHADGYITVYAHEASIDVKKGDHVAQGQTIGTAGTTGGVNSPELHFEVRYQTRPVNPRPLLSQTVARASS
jgi:murein DD-endopeptidase MepM/ murein hydrolase activator NlpD